ncbi:MAG TPA: P1 family peptidase [Actinomycetota bacterium]|nr:P1 family peptidase [Actinomycetota bacterium]
MITDVAGIRVGHFTDLDAATGCTVVLPPPGTVGSGEVRGGAPGTRETDLLRPGMLVEEVHAVLLTGGSAFGLAAAEGVVAWLEERGIGFDTGVAKVPIVPAAVLFDLGVGSATVRPGPDQGRAACDAASGRLAEGSVGAGTGATVAKLHGPHRAVKGGIGTASAREQELVVGALFAVNAVGEILDEQGGVLAGARPSNGDEATDQDGHATSPPFPMPGTSTVIGVVATNARLSKERAHLLAVAAHDGVPAAVRPAHTLWDGDTVFTLATGEVEADQETVERLVEHVVAGSIRRGVRAATSIGGVPAVGDPPGGEGA